MRILAVTPYYEPEGGGLERYAHEILARLAAQGHAVLAIAATRTGLGDATRAGVIVRRVRPSLFLGNAPVDPRLAGILERTVRAFRPDVVTAHTPVPFPAEMAYRAARAAGVPFVPTYHAGMLRGSSPALQALAQLDRWTLERSMLAGSRRLIAVAPYVRDNALRRHKDRVTVIPPGVDAARFRPDGTPPVPGNVLFVGPLSRRYAWKGVDVLWDAFTLLRRRFPRATLTLVGDGPRRREYLVKARREGVRVRAPGRVALRRLVQEYRRATVTVLPSTTDAESFGMVLAESNACGRPVVASRVGGVADYVRHRDNGLLVPPREPGALADRITQVLLDPAEASRMGERGRRRVVQEHDWDHLAGRTLRVLEGACEAG